MKKGRGNPIPQSVRLVVTEREGGRCFRCGMRGSEMSHRRRRGVRDGQEHSPSNLQLFCRTCHVWLHSNPVEAMEYGWAVSSYEDNPGSIPTLRWDEAWLILEDSGAVRFTHSPL